MFINKQRKLMILSNVLRQTDVNGVTYILMFFSNNIFLITVSVKSLH